MTNPRPNEAGSEGAMSDVRMYCACGAGMEGEVDPRGVAFMLEAWESVHFGAGHSGCTQQAAIQAYRDANNGEMPLGHAEVTP
jgi:hypothetical protein